MLAMNQPSPSATNTSNNCSSSSHEPNTSSSLSSGGTLSSMETIPTQEVQEGDFDFAEEKLVVWGRLYPVGKSFKSVGEP